MRQPQRLTAAYSAVGDTTASRLISREAVDMLAMSRKRAQPSALRRSLVPREVCSMAGLRWVRLDTSIMANAKVLAALDEDDGYRAVCVYMLGLAWIGQQDNAGFIPRHALRAFHASRDDAAMLVSVGLWAAVDGGWQVPDWDEYQPSGEEAKARSARAQRAARARWDAPGNA